MSQNIVLKASGLNPSPNQLEAPPGSLTEASNIIIKRDAVIEKRRGYRLYGTAMPSVNDRAYQLMQYKNRVLRQYFDHLSSTYILQYDGDGNGAFLNFSGTYPPAQIGLRTKYIEANGNLYFTSANGIQKISAMNASQFTTASNYITLAGGIKAIDVSASVILQQGNVSGFLPQDSSVAYRVVWGSNDANNNLILGTPSQRAVVSFSLLTADILDFNTVLGALNNVSTYSGNQVFNRAIYTVPTNNTDYVNSFLLPASAAADTLYTTLQNLCTQIDSDILYANNSGAPLTISNATLTNVTVNSTGVVTINFSSGDPTQYWVPGSLINIQGIVIPGTVQITGPQQISVVTAPVGMTPGSIQFTSQVFPNTIPPTYPAATSSATSTTGATITSYEYTARQPTATAIAYQVTTNPNNTGGTYNLPSEPPTDNDLLNLQYTIAGIMARLQAENNLVINTSVASQYIANLVVTTTANVNVTFSVPERVTTNDFYQIYRSSISQATGTTVLANIPPGDELQLVYEAFPTQAQITAGSITVEDITPALFAGAYLYSNQISGQGTLQTNDVPPYALDINLFKNYTFYANTSTLQNQSISLLGVTSVVSGYNPSNPPQLTITDGTTSNTYTFVLGVKQVTTIVCNAGSTLAASGSASYFKLYNADSLTQYYFWYKIGTAVDPAIVGATGIPIIASASDNSTQIAVKTTNAINLITSDFMATNSTNTITVTNNNEGYTTAPSAGTSGFTITIATSGKGQNAALKQILLSQNVSPAIAVDETARSIIAVVNQNPNDIVYVYYLSSNTSVPGQMEFEARSLGINTIYFLTNNATLGNSFSPQLAPDLTISNISIAAATVVTTTTAHGLLNDAQIVISGSNSTPSIDGLYAITYLSPTTFSLPITVTVAGNTGAIIPAIAAAITSNEAFPNRIYYSKVSQPDAVPSVNYLDVGALDKAILRVFPLRDSFFVYKEDGLWRISGETAPFTVSLFDQSTVLLAPDSLGLCNNLIYGWTTQGISATSEAGVVVTSRPIDINILPLASAQYPNFKTVTWGVGYDSDNSYTVYTNVNTSDTIAQIGYRYSNLTNSWTTFDKTDTCGLVNTFDDRQYLGAGDTNYCEQERKSFNRTDYADREIASIISNGTLNGVTLTLPSLTGLSIGDVVSQTLNLTVYTYNSLLQKLDIDSNVGTTQITSIPTGATSTTITTSAPHQVSAGDSIFITGSNCIPSIDGTYLVTAAPSTTTLTIPLTYPILTSGNAGKCKYSYALSMPAKAGDNLKTDLLNLATQLDNDPGTVNKNYYALISAKSGSVTANTRTNPTIITSAAHGLVNGRTIDITGSNSLPSINGENTITLINANSFSIPVNVNTTAGTAGSWFTVDSDFGDIVACYNAIITNLNSDTGLSLKNYLTVTSTTEIEAIILGINQVSKQVTLSAALNFIVGPITIFQAINSEFTYSPNTMGDSLSLKHLREATIMFENKAFTQANLNFATDLNPSFQPVPFFGDGNGIFGNTPKFGQNYFGGNSNSVPMRTYVPGSCQRCRYIVVQFNHSIAREKVSIFGITIVGDISSTRAYR